MLLPRHRMHRQRDSLALKWGDEPKPTTPPSQVKTIFRYWEAEVRLSGFPQRVSWNVPPLLFRSKPRKEKTAPVPNMTIPMIPRGQKLSNVTRSSPVARRFHDGSERRYCTGTVLACVNCSHGTISTMAAR